MKAISMRSLSTNRSIAAAAMAFLIGGAGLAGCGNSASKVTVAQTLPTAWSSGAKKDVETIARKIQGSDAKSCKKVVFLEPANIVAAQQRYDWVIAPTALADCDAFGNTLEIATFESSKDRDAFVAERSESICRRAAAVDAPIPPFQWATGDKWSVQGDTRGGVDRAAKRLGGEAETRRCPKNERLGWSKAGVANVRAIAAVTTQANVQCEGFALMERKSFLQGREGAKTPTALGACLSADGRALFVAGFDKDSMPKDDFVAEILGDKTVCAAPSQAVIGPDWAAIAPAALAPAVATATGGTLGAICGS
ncbi:MAG: hypothetical protein F2782_03115 [Actinobacteria bacterium]|uniref:Unannotated protein n=1 Tax=freshwater metagenome TaxID=449393 RepID=A0A6J7D0L1_9ZZZZ|nr:hypothetical protein [Actinomycetota bacterium]